MKKSEISSNKQSLCPICMDNPVDAETNICSHKFCYACINKWTAKKPNCPICRRKIRKIKHGNQTKIVKQRTSIYKSYFNNLRETRQIPPNPQPSPVQFTQMPNMIPIIGLNIPNPYIFGYYFVPFGSGPVILPQME